MKIKLLHCKTINRNRTANHRQNKEPTKKSETLSDAPYLREHTHTHTHTHARTQTQTKKKVRLMGIQRRLQNSKSVLQN